MSEYTPDSPRDDKTPRSYATEPPRYVTYAALPPDVTLRPENITFKHNRFVVSVLTMLVTSLVIFFIPFFNGLLGGTFGGFHAGRVKRALGAALASSVLGPGAMLFLFAFSYSFDVREPMYFYSGLGLGGWVALYALGTFIGAVAGAYCRPATRSPRELEAGSSIPGNLQGVR